MQPNKINSSTDPLEKLYAESFSDYNVMPSDELFSRIQKNIPTSQKPVISKWTKYKAPIQVLLITSLALNFYWAFLTFVNPSDKISSKVKTATPAIIHKNETANNTEELINSENTYKPATTIPTTIKSNTQKPSQSESQDIEETKKEEETSPLESLHESSIVLPKEPNEDKTEVLPTNPKKETTFFKKYSEQYKDSLRPLFVK